MSYSMKKGGLLLLLSVFLLQSCGGAPVETENSVMKNPVLTEESGALPETNVQAPAGNSIVTKAKDLYTEPEDGIPVDLSDPRSGEGFTAERGVITVTAEGTYILTGTLEEGCVVVAADKGEDVRLVLADASIHCSEGSPIEVISADKVIISLPEGTENTLTNDSGVDFETTDIAGILSKEDLTINGTGTLFVRAGSGDGVRSKDTLKITGGNLRITAADRGLVGKDSVEITDVSAEILSGGDGIKSTNEEEPECGYICIEGGTFRIQSEKDGIEAKTSLRLSGGTFDITTGTGSYESSGDSFGMGGRGGFGGWDSAVASGAADTESQKALKAGTILAVTGGILRLDSYDDAIHADGDVSITGGTISAASGDDGVHAEETVTIAGGTLDITRSYEGIEGKVICMTDGSVTVIASDDGLNATDGTGDTMGMFTRGQEAEDAEIYVTLSGGSLYVDAGGDGLDSNGIFTIDGGTIVVHGPENGANGYVDTAGSFTVNGGTYFGMGTSQMLVTPSQNSAQLSLTWSSGVHYAGGSTVELRDNAGNVLFSAESVRRFNSITFSSPELCADEAYAVYINGEAVSSVTAGAGMGSSGFGGQNPFVGGGRGERPNGGNRPGGFGGGYFPGMPDGGFGGGNPPELPEGGFGDGNPPEIPQGGMMPGVKNGA